MRRPLRKLFHAAAWAVILLPVAVALPLTHFEIALGDRPGHVWSVGLSSDGITLRTGGDGEIHASVGVLLACSAASLAAWITFADGTLRSPRRGVCPTCGYDCRATPERCPECGTVLEAKDANR